MIPRFKYASDFKVNFWTWKWKEFIGRVYYDGWNNFINLGFICFSWITPPLKGDFQQGGKE